MSPAVKLARFAAVLGFAFGVGWGIGAITDPIIEPTQPAPPTHEHTGFGEHGGG